MLIFRVEILRYVCYNTNVEWIMFLKRKKAMELLEKKISECGKIYPGDVLKVDGFINHLIDTELMCEVGKEFYRLFSSEGITKVLTIEASGIGIACLTAQYFHVPVLFAKKSKSSNMADDSYVTKVASYTHNKVYDVVVSKEYLSSRDKVLIIDDFLAKGNALEGLIDLVNQAGASLAGCGIVVEKVYQGGGNILRSRGVRVESLAMVESMSVEDGIKFCKN